MAEKNNGTLEYGCYQLFFLLALCMSSYIFLKYYVICLAVLIIFKLLTRINDQFFCEDVDVQGRGVFITGCDTDKRGFTVFAGCLNKDSPGAASLRTECSSQIHIVEVNTTKQESVTAAFTYVKKHLPGRGLWGVINNAGMDMLGEVELSPIPVYEKGFELNLYGYIRVMKTFLPLIRHSKGRVVNVSSVRGRIVEPNQSNYCTAKHGIETVSDSLRLEMIKFGVKVCIIEPGNFRNATAIGSEAVIRRNQQEVNEMWDSAREEVKQSYSKRYVDSWINQPAGGWPPKADSTVVAEAVAHALCSPNPKHRYLIQGKVSIVPFADEFVVLPYVYTVLPTWIVDKYVALWKKCLKFNK